MRDPAREEQGRMRLRRIHRIEAHVREVIARVVDGHQHHHNSAQQVNGIDAREGDSALRGCQLRSTRHAAQRTKKFARRMVTVTAMTIEIAVGQTCKRQRVPSHVAFRKEFRMYRIYTQTALTATLAAFAFAQAPQTSTPPTTERSTAQQAAAASSDTKSYRGVLMDASCKAIQDRASSSVSSDASSSNAATRARAADSTGIGGAASRAPSGAGTSGSLSTTTNSGGTGASASTSAVTSATTGVATDQSGQATATKETTPPTEARSTASASGATLSGSSSNTNYRRYDRTGRNKHANHFGVLDCLDNGRKHDRYRGYKRSQPREPHVA